MFMRPFLSSSVFGVLTASVLFVSSALAQETVPQPHKGDTAWMLLATVLVVLMTLPGLALFYAGLVRSKNVLSVLMQVFLGFSLIAVAWVVYGYSFAFSGSADSTFVSFIGDGQKLFLRGVMDLKQTGVDFPNVATFSKGVVIPEMVYVIFQLTFAAITPALIVGAFAERMKFSAIMLFLLGWFTLSYLPLAHMVWFWPGPDAFTFAAEKFASIKAALNDPRALELALAAEAAKVQATGGFLWAKGALDFAGGTVVHINAGVAGLVCALMLGKRIGYLKEHMPPHNLPMTFIGACLLWVGWFGFNAGSNLEANGLTALAVLNTLVAPAVGAMAWAGAEGLKTGKPSLLGALSGAVAGMVAITPAAGFVGPLGAIVIGFSAGIICLYAVIWLKHALGYDDSLDVFGVHGVGGVVGALLTGVFVNPALGGVGVTDYVAIDGTSKLAPYDFVTQMTAQVTAVGVAVLWSAVVSFVLLSLLKYTLGLRVSEQEEREGLDLAAHGERAYN